MSARPKSGRRDTSPARSTSSCPSWRKKADRLNKKKPVAVYCDSGYRANLAASLLLRNWFTEVRNVPGSWKAWTASGYEIEKPAEDKKASDTDR